MQFQIEICLAGLLLHGHRCHLIHLPQHEHGHLGQYDEVEIDDVIGTCALLLAEDDPRLVNIIWSEIGGIDLGQPEHLLPNGRRANEHAQGGSDLPVMLIQPLDSHRQVARIGG